MRKSILLALGVVPALCFAAPAEAQRRSAMANTPHVALVAELPDDPRFEAYGPDGKPITLDLGWSYREFSALWMPFWAYEEAGFVFYSQDAKGEYNVAPATPRELAAIKELLGRDYAAEYRFPLHEHLWGWLAVLAVAALLFWQHRRDARAKAAAGIM